LRALQATWIVRTLLGQVFRLFLALAASFLVFTLVSFLHGFFGDALQKKPTAVRPQVVAIAVPKKHEEEPKPVQRVRIVKATTGRSGNAGGSQSNMRFVPDLGAESGPGNANGVALASQDLGAEVFEDGQTDEAAVPVFTPAVPFPEQAREMNIEGVVKTIFVVNYLGKVTSVDVLKSPDQVFTREVKRVLATWRFKPAKNKGVPVNVRFSKEIEFTLEQ
jgi:TonB family protein